MLKFGREKTYRRLVMLVHHVRKECRTRLLGFARGGACMHESFDRRPSPHLPTLTIECKELEFETMYSSAVFSCS